MQLLEEQLKKEYDLVFQDKTLLETAFTHTSYANEHRSLTISHNERLEFLGDAALQLVISDYLYKTYPQLPEGDLSKMRSGIVREESLAIFAKMCQFHQFIKLGKGEEKTGGRERATILGDLFEAFLGALFLDKGFEEVKRFLYQVIIPQVEADTFEKVTDYKTKLQELLQVNGNIAIDYQVTKEEGPSHDKWFEVVVVVNGKMIGYGSGRSKKQAEQEAARMAIEKGASCF